MVWPDGDEAADDGVADGQLLAQAKHNEGQVEEDHPEGGQQAGTWKAEKWI